MPTFPKNDNNYFEPKLYKICVWKKNQTETEIAQLVKLISDIVCRFSSDACKPLGEARKGYFSINTHYLNIITNNCLYMVSKHVGQHWAQLLSRLRQAQKFSNE